MDELIFMLKYDMNFSSYRTINESIGDIVHSEDFDEKKKFLLANFLTETWWFEGHTRSNEAFIFSRIKQGLIVELSWAHHADNTENLRKIFYEWVRITETIYNE
jgi:hypothetical protein